MTEAIPLPFLQALKVRKGTYLQNYFIQRVIQWNVAVCTIFSYKMKILISKLIYLLI